MHPCQPVACSMADEHGEDFFTDQVCTEQPAVVPGQDDIGYTSFLSSIAQLVAGR